MGLRNVVVAAVYLLFCLCWMAQETETSETKGSSSNAEDASFLLDEQSVVLITGAAGFIGSELAVALHSTYKPKKIICVDSMGDVDSDLAFKEFKRQRVFRLLQSAAAAKDNVFFYRVDFRPSVPEYFDSSEVPVLHHIFVEHPEISHVVHLADDQQQPQIVKRKKGDEKAGMIESLLEQLLLQKDNTGKAPHFVYASSHEVYNNRADFARRNNPNPPPFAEDLPLTTPSTISGASKLTDELIARAYQETHGIASTGLRFFDVYGPWGPPGSVVFEMAERAVAGEDPVTAIPEEASVENVADFIFIDDAVDAILAAMQFQTKQAVVINVGTGTGTTLRAMASLIKQQQKHQPPLSPDDSGDTADAQTISYANTHRASTLLGFTPQISLEKGVRTTLAWHYDRAYPYGSLPDEGGGGGVVEPSICDKYDTDCLRGTPVFPCASECANDQQCKQSLYDDVLALTQAVTAQCDTVLYTVTLDTALQEIPSTHVRVSTLSIAYVESSTPGGGHCNLAFVAESSPLYERLARTSTTPDGVVQHGYWSLIPVAVTEFAHGQKAVLEMLPKLSPAKFFADTVTKAIYVDPNVIIDNIPRLLQESNMQPEHASVQGATAILIGKQKVDVVQEQHPLHATTEPVPANVLAQDTAYRMIRMAVIDEMIGDGFAQKLDSGLVVHTLRSADDDMRLFRCDVFSEVVQWRAETDQAALEFILGLHDMWSRVVVKKSGLEPWWIGDDVSTVPAGAAITSRRRLQQVSPEDGEAEEHPAPPRQLMEQQQQQGAGVISVAADEDDETTGVEAIDGVTGGESDTAQSDNKNEHNGFGVVQEAIEAVFGYNSNNDKQQQQQRFERPEDEGDDDFVVDDDDAAEFQAGVGADEAEAPQYLPLEEQDPSSYDVWMGVLSSTPLRYFGRIVSMEAVGAYRVTDAVEEKEL